MVTLPGDGDWSRRLDGTVVGFQADQLCPETGAGWEVLVVGRAAVLTTGPTAVTVTLNLDQAAVVTGSRFTL